MVESYSGAILDEGYKMGAAIKNIEAAFKNEAYDAILHYMEDYKEAHSEWKKLKEKERESNARLRLGQIKNEMARFLCENNWAKVQELLDEALILDPSIPTKKVV